MDYERFLDLVKNRRSIRDFKNDPIPDGDVEKIIETARWAPSGFNSQPWEFVVVKKKELRESIIQFIADLRKEGQSKAPPQKPAQVAPIGFANAPVLILLFGDPRVRPWAPPPVRANDERWNDVFISSLAIGFQYLHLAAGSLGLASQWVSTVAHPKVASQIKQLLGIPPFMEIYDMMALGYAGADPRDKPMRDLKQMVHYDDCGEGDFRSDEAVKAYFERKD
ncbi:MAG: nitroreductase family protein [Deltaproteobacteria bacterium]|nr:nitroreductase family protein [Deltaproteobacteria bacterium]